MGIRNAMLQFLIFNKIHVSEILIGYKEIRDTDWNNQYGLPTQKMQVYRSRIGRWTACYNHYINGYVRCKCSWQTSIRLKHIFSDHQQNVQAFRRDCDASGLSESETALRGVLGQALLELQGRWSEDAGVRKGFGAGDKSRKIHTGCTHGGFQEVPGPRTAHVQVSAPLVRLIWQSVLFNL